MASVPDTGPGPAGGPASEMLLSAIEAGLEVFDLGRPYTVGMPQSPNHPAYRHALDRRHGDRMRDCGGSAAADIITLGCHVGTHIDALAHVSQDGKLHGGIDADEAQRGGEFTESGIHTVDPIAGRGLLLDVPAALGPGACDDAGYLPGGYEITVDDLKCTLDTQGTDIHFAPGQLDTGSQAGMSLLGHELTHVVQQSAGRVSMPMGSGAPINASTSLEAEADSMGAMAAISPDET